MELTCPKCQAPMRSYERNGVTVDQCSECRGLFLDRGELERLVDAENAWHGGAASPSRQATPPPRRDDDHRGQQHQYQQAPYQQPSYGKPHKRRKSFLEELFD